MTSDVAGVSRGLNEPEVATLSFEQLVARARALVEPGKRRILGVTGSPGAGKSTLCAALVEALGQDALLVGMDGFHLANEELIRLGRRERKGAPDTFDIGGYVSLLERVRAQTVPIVYAPMFNRGIEESIGSAVPVFSDTPLVITEGNYLLFDRLGWHAVQPLLDETWFLEVESEVRASRLVLRRQGFGESVADARRWVRDVDFRNADLVDPSRSRADLVVHLTTFIGAEDGQEVERHDE